MVNKFKIGNITIGDNCEPVIITELGINHSGKLDKAIYLADEAIKSGAKIIKHQTHVVEDEITGLQDKINYQYWHFSKEVIKKLSISSVDINNEKLEPLIEEKWHSSYYGTKEKSIRLSFKTKTNKFTTKIIYKK